MKMARKRTVFRRLVSKGIGKEVVESEGVDYFGRDVKVDLGFVTGASLGCRRVETSLQRG